MILNLLHGYKAASDVTFRGYIGRAKEDYVDGHRNITIDELMLMADNKYKELTEQDEWMDATDVQKIIVALTAALDHVKKEAATLKQKVPNGTKNPKNPKNDAPKKKTRQRDYL